MWNTKEEVVGGLFDMFSEEKVKQNIDENWSSLKNIGVPEGLLQGKPTTTEADFSKSLGNAIYNLPSQVPRLTKDVVHAVYNPLEFVEGVHSAGQGLMTNVSDVFYDAVLPDSLFNLLKENQPEEITQNEKMMESVGESLLDPQVRREIAQQYGIEGLLGYAALPKNLAKLGDKQTKFLEKIVEDTAPFGNTIGTQIFAGDVATGTGFNVAKYGERAAAKAKAEQMVKDGGINYENLSNIWYETGHFVTPSGKVLWEIDDSAMKFTPTEGYASMLYDNRNVRVGDDMGSMKLIDMVDHPQLYENYPRLKDAKIVFVKGKTTDGYAHDTRGALGSYHVGDNIVRVMVDPKIGLTPKSAEIIVHEIQHGIQTIEAIPGGASNSAQYWDAMDAFFKKELDYLTKLDQSTTWLYGERVFDVEGTSYYGQPSANQRDPKWFADRIKQLKKYRSDIKDVGSFDPSMSPMALAKQTKKREALYYRTEGEWLARITEGRKKLENEDSLLNTDFPLPKGWREKTSPLEQADTGTSDYTLMTGRHKSNYDKALKQFYEKDVISQGDYLTREIRRHAGINVKNLKTGLLELPWRTGGKEGDLYITRVGTNAGTVSKTRTSANDIAINLDKNQLEPDFAYYLLMHLQPKINARAHGTAQQAIKKSDIDDILMEYFTEGK
jgi:hypothetical protein